MAGVVADNPHNQIFALGIQGLIGTIMLLAMWITHLCFFCAPGLPAEIGLAVITQNISALRSTLCFPTNGWRSACSAE
jgi:hypothetical protein